MVDDQHAGDDLDEICSKFDVQSIAMDPAGARWVMGRLMDEYKPVIEIPQAAIHLSEPMRTLAGYIDNQKIIHNSKPNWPLSWIISNIVN